VLALRAAFVRGERLQQARRLEARALWPTLNEYGGAAILFFYGALRAD
jgi:hypothetical protein